MTLFSVQGHYHAETYLGPLVPVALGICIATAYKDILYNCALPTLWKQFGDDLHMGVMVMP